MFRKISAKLAEWKNSKYRKPLILQGARQVGKTYVVFDFAKNEYDNIAYINFEIDSDAKLIFENKLAPDELIPKIEIFTKQTVAKNKTLIFFDEIQLCPNALTSLKYFYEFAPEYHIISAGSLLSVACSRESHSFPVGKINRLTMYPMDFEEYLLASDYGKFVEIIKKCYEHNEPMDKLYHNAVMDRYRQYLVVGGMPECVAKFMETGDHGLIRSTQKEILNAYLDDMGKYNNANEIKKTRLTYNSITSQLSKKNTRFQYKLVKQGGRAKELENAVEWLVLSGICHRVHFLDTIKKPLDNYKNADGFKIFMSDAGLLCAKNNIPVNEILYGSAELNDFKGGMTENYVCSQLIANNYTCYTWHSGGEAEMDFIIQLNDGKIIPVEVKSADNSRAKSLQIYKQKFEPEYAIKISANNFGFTNGVKTIPLYAAFYI